MKKFFILALFVLGVSVKDVHCEDSQSVFSLPKRTTYEGTVKDWCNQWNILSYSYLGAYNPLAGAITYKYVFGKDILINDKTYVELMRYSTTDTTEMGTYICALRFTENKKVYIHYDNAEYLLNHFFYQQQININQLPVLQFQFVPPFYIQVYLLIYHYPNRQYL